MDALVFDDIDDNQSSEIEEIDDDFFEPICSSSDMSDFEKIDLTEDNVNKGLFKQLTLKSIGGPVFFFLLNLTLALKVRVYTVRYIL